MSSCRRCLMVTTCSLLAMESTYDVTKFHPPSTTKTAILVPGFNAPKNFLQYIRNSWARYSLHFVPVIYIIYNSTRCVVITLISHNISVSMVLRIAGKTEGGCSNVSAVGFSWGQSSLSRPRGAKLQGFTGLTAD